MSKIIELSCDFTKADMAANDIIRIIDSLGDHERYDPILDQLELALWGIRERMREIAKSATSSRFDNPTDENVRLNLLARYVAAVGFEDSSAELSDGLCKMMHCVGI